MLDPLFALALGGLFALLWAHAALSKARARREFLSALNAYELVPATLLSLLGAVVPLLEAALAVGMVPGATRRVAAIGSAVLLLAYAAAIKINLNRGRRDLDCGCAGPGERRPIRPWMVWRNLALALASLALAAPVADRPLAVADRVSVVCCVLALAMLYMAFERLFRDRGRGVGARA